MDPRMSPGIDRVVNWWTDRVEHLGRKERGFAPQSRRLKVADGSELSMSVPPERHCEAWLGMSF
jgi:hypothetical protein